MPRWWPDWVRPPWRCPRPTREDQPGPGSGRRIRAKTFAHVMVAQPGFESSFRDVTGVADPTTLLTFRATVLELLALVHAGMPFLQTAVVTDDRRDGDRRRHPDWAEVADLVTRATRFVPRRSWRGCWKRSREPG